MIQAEKERKEILAPNSVHNRPGKENSEKNSKKISKIGREREKNFRQAEKGKKKILVPNSAHTGHRHENSEKKQQKNSKN